jgi:hypothetical protein
LTGLHLLLEEIDSYSDWNELHSSDKTELTGILWNLSEYLIIHWNSLRFMVLKLASLIFGGNWGTLHGKEIDLLLSGMSNVIVCTI